MSQLILRREALAHCAMFENSSCRILNIQAQAGQGKTVLAMQFDDASASPFAWTNCTHTLNTPRLLFDKVLVGLDEALPSFFANAVSEALQQPLADPEFIEIAASRIQAEFEASGRSAYLVFDDVHRLEGAEGAKQLLRKLVDATSDDIKFLFISRYPLALDGKPLFPSSATMQIDKSLLAFSREEIAVLYNDVLGEPAGTRKIGELYEATEGWVSGLKLLHSSGTVRRLVNADTSSLGEYFDELLLPSLTRGEYKEMAQFALLEDLPEALLRAKASPGTLEWIEDLVAKNCFVRAVRGEGGRTFRFHHIFQEYLAGQAETLLTAREKTEFFSRAGDWLFAEQRINEGLHCYVMARDWPRMAEAIETHCLPLLALNHHHLLLDLLESVPEDVVQSFPWLLFAYGATQGFSAPQRSCSSLELALDRFRTEGCELGELLASCFLLNFHTMSSGELGRAATLVPKAAAIFDRLQSRLTAPAMAACAQSIMLGRIYCENDSESASRLRHLVEKTLDSSLPANLWLILTRVIVHGFKGEAEQALEVLSPFFGQYHSRWTGPATRFFLATIELNSLLMTGRMAEYRAFRHEVQRDWDAFLKHSFLGEFLVIWNLDLLLSEGRYADMLTVCREFLAERGTLPHIRSQAKHYEMLAYAHLGHRGRAKRAMREALRVRAKVGGPYFTHLTQCLAGGALSLAGDERSASRIFEKYGRPLKTGLSPYLKPITHAYAAAMHLRNGEIDQARAQARVLLSTMEKGRSRHFFGWSPAVMEPVISFAVKEGIHAGYARKLAWWRLRSDILDDGTVVPLMQVRLVGGLQLAVGEAVMQTGDLSQNWRSVIRMLVFNPKHEMEVSEIQSALWPEEDPADSRSKFDTMLSRLRTALSKPFGKSAVKRHLRLRAQRLSLCHCLTDYDRVKHYAEQGIAHAEKNNFWQAHTSFSSMMQWIGPRLEQLPAPMNLPDRFAPIVSRAFKHWLGVLISNGAKEQALTVVERALELEPLNDEMHRKRYNLLTSLKRLGEAVSAIQGYRNFLQEHDFSQDEIGQIIESILLDV